MTNAVPLFELAQPLLLPAATLLGTAVAAWAIIWLLQPFAAQLGLIDHPHDERKRHDRPTPVTGGLGLVGALLLFFWLFPQPMTMPKAAFLMGGGLLIVLGIVDDLIDMHWSWRLLWQTVAALVMVYVGGVQVEQLGDAFGMGHLELGWLGAPFTVFATVGLINAVNMIDGADGISGSLVSAALLMLAAAAWYAGNAALAMIALGLLAATLGFLAHNFPLPWRPKARVFLGNAGSAFLGFSIAWISFRLTQNPSHPVSPVLALWLLPIPVMDCLVLIVRRLREGRSPFAAGRDHIHHIMQDAGFSNSGIALALTMFSLLAGLVVAQSIRVNVPEVALTLVFVLLCVAWYAFSLRPLQAQARARADTEAETETPAAANVQRSLRKGD